MTAGQVFGNAFTASLPPGFQWRKNRVRAKSLVFLHVSVSAWGGGIPVGEGGGEGVKVNKSKVIALGHRR